MSVAEKDKSLARWCSEHQRWCNSHQAIELDVWIWYEQLRKEVERLKDGADEYFNNYLQNGAR